MNVGKFVGSVLIVIGTIIGAGMLALPMVSASAGFVWSALLMVALWLVALVTGLFVIEVNLALPSQNSTFSSMTERTLGLVAKLLTWGSTLFLLYAMLVAYIMGESDILVNYFSSAFKLQISHTVIAATFTVVLGIAVFWSTAAADYFNRGLISAKGLLVIGTLALIMPKIDISKLVACSSTSNIKYLWMALPAFTCAYCYQFVIPSLRMYVGESPKQLRLIVVVGTTVAMLIYLWWLASILGVVPLEGANSFTSLAQIKGASVGMFTQMVITIVASPIVTKAINWFTIVAMTTSFIGVALSLFDFLADGLKRKNSRTGRLQTALLTFVPPLIFALFFAEGFVKAINYVALPISLLCIILPALMVYRLRKSVTLQSPYRVRCGNWIIWLIALVGFASIILSILCIMGQLPGLKIG